MISVNLLCRDVAFLTMVFAMQAHRQSRDFASLLHAGQPLQLHSDAASANHPLPSLLPSLLPEPGPRGGVEIRLHEAEPDACAKRFKEAVILSPSGYASIPSRRI